MKYDLADYFISRSSEGAAALSIRTNMFAYDCQVSKMAKDAGYMPMLYTDADYAASNACYEKIGYVLRGKLCTIG